MTTLNPPTIKSVPFMHGWHWIVAGFRMYRENPVMWVILFVIYFVIMVVVSKLPIVGGVASTLLAPVFAAGMMLGCRAMEKEQDLEINHLFAGFKQNTAQLIAIGGIYIISLLIIAMLVVLATDKASIELLANGRNLNPEQSSEMAMPLSVALLLMLPLLMAYWFAPVLVVLNKMQALDAMKLSLEACIKNILPFFLFSFVYMLLFVVGALLISLGALVAVPVVLAMFLVVPSTMTSLYASYADIFDHYHLVKLPENNS
jgi:uncharacterized membrane protein